MNKPTLLLRLTTAFSGLFMIGLIIAAFAIAQFSKELPDADSIRQVELKVPLRVFSADGLLISEFGNERRKPISYADTPQALINAVLASEDDGFFQHWGIDPLGLVRAALANFKTGRSGQGASTITMQVARNFFLSPEKTYSRKLKEVLLAIRLEQILSKEEILSLYLNKIFLGHRAYGFGAAAEVYYGKPLDQLDLAQTAMLAGLPKAPSSYNPIRNPSRALIRRNYVLNRMHTLGWITTEGYEQAKAQPATAEKHSREAGLNAPHIAEMVRAQLIEQFGEDAYWQGLNVYTTILSGKQNAASSALRTGLRSYDRRHGFRGSVGHVEINSIEIDPSAPAAAYEAVLRDYPNSQEQIPALTLTAESERATLWTRDTGQIELDVKGVKWAKRHLTANRVGKRPKELSDVLEPGDIVYIEPAKQDADKQDDPEQTVGWQLSQIPSVSGSIISIDPNTGEILSLVGGYDFFLNKYNRATQSIRQPGSNIKPFIYSAALEQGFSPASLISGAPIVLTDPAHGTRWRPENYSGKFFGPTRMREALAKSMNLVSIRLLRSIGIPFARDYLSRFGIDMSRFSRSLSMALGSGGVKPLEMISAYTVLANGGYKIQPYFIEKVMDRNGEIIFQAPQPTFCDDCIADFLPKPEPIEFEQTADELALDEGSPTDIPLEETLDSNESLEEQETDSRFYVAPRVMTHANNFLIVSMLKGVVSRGTARKARSLKRSDLAGTPGTTNDYVDAWFTGFNSKVVTTVWVGFDNPQTMGKGEAGSLAALPIWIDYMKTGLKDIPEDAPITPPYIEEGFVDRRSGQRTDETDPSATPEYFVINELTPEYQLIQAAEAANIETLNGAPEELGIDPDPETQTLQEPPVDAEFLDDQGNEIELLEENALSPSEKIIEQKEDTDGLF